jgi:hypothetical protein
MIGACRLSRVAVDERFAAIVSASSKDGGLMLFFEPIGGTTRFDGVHGRFTISVWREGSKTIRMSLRTEASGTTAYLQGGMPLLDVANELGLVISR